MADQDLTCSEVKKPQDRKSTQEIQKKSFFYKIEKEEEKAQ